MKLIRSVIRPNKIDDLKAALCRINVLGLTVSEVNDHGPHNWQTVAWRGHEHKLNFVARLEVVAVVQDDDVDEVVSVIIRTARTNQRADGHVSVLPVEHRYNIHTGEREVVQGKVERFAAADPGEYWFAPRIGPTKDTKDTKLQS